MSLDFYLEALRPTTVYDRNITHNLCEMAEAAGIYKCLWRPDEHRMLKAADIIQPLKDGLALLRSDAERFKKYEPDNGWGSYDGLVRFAQATLDACLENQDADIRVSR